MNAELTTGEMVYGRKRYLLFAICNGFSVALLAESTLILYGLKIGIPDYITGIMSSFIFLGMPFMLLGKILINRKGLSKTVFIGWLSRSICVLCTISAPFFIKYFSFYTGITVFLIGSYGFYAFRGIGVIGATPLVGEITNDENRADFNALTSITYNSGYFISMSLLIIIFEFSDSIQLFQIAITLGSILGISASILASKVPETEIPKISASVSLKQSLFLLLRLEHGKKLFWIQTFFQIISALIIPYSVIILKVTYGVKDYKAMLFVLIQMLGGILMALIIKKVSTKIKPEFFITFIYSLFIFPLILWIMSPAKFYWFYCALIFFTGGLANTGGNICLTHYFLNAIPAKMRISAMIIITAISSTIAGLFGSVIGGGILKILNIMNFSISDTREGYFLIILFLFFICLVPILKIQQYKLIRTGITFATNSVFAWKRIVFSFLNLK